MRLETDEVGADAHVPMLRTGMAAVSAADPFLVVPVAFILSVASATTAVVATSSEAEEAAGALLGVISAPDGEESERVTR